MGTPGPIGTRGTPRTFAHRRRGALRTPRAEGAGHGRWRGSEGLGRGEVRYDFGELDALALAYATTVHKAQGSEYPAVVILLTTQHYPMLRRKLVYTGVTRGRRLVVVVGQRRALAMAVRGRDAGRRWSRHKEWLTAATRAESQAIPPPERDRA